MSKANVGGNSDLGIVDEIDESIKLWNMYVSNFPENGVAWMKLGMVLQVRDGLQSDGGVHRPRALLAFYSALKYMDVKSDPIILVYHRMGMLLKIMGRLDESLSSHESSYLLATNPIDKALSLHFRGDIQKCLGRILEAKHSYRQAILHFPFHITSFCGVVECMQYHHCDYSENDWQAILTEIKYVLIGLMKENTKPAPHAKAKGSKSGKSPNSISVGSPTSSSDCLFVDSVATLQYLPSIPSVASSSHTSKPSKSSNAASNANTSTLLLPHAYAADQFVSCTVPSARESKLIMYSNMTMAPLGAVSELYAAQPSADAWESNDSAEPTVTKSTHVPSDVFYAMAACCDRAKDSKQALYYLQMAHMQQKAFNAKSSCRYSMDEQSTLVDNIMKVFNPCFWPPNVGHASNKLVFIIGMCRSGASLLEQVIDAHSKCIGLGEDSIFSTELPKVKSALSHALLNDDGQHAEKHRIDEGVLRISGDILQKVVKKAKMTNVLNSELSNCLRGVDSGRGINCIGDDTGSCASPQDCSKTNAVEPPRDLVEPTYIVDKLVQNYKNVGLIHLLYPNALILHVVRDPLDCLWSCFRHKFDEKALQWTLDFEHICHEYVLYLRLMKHWQSALPNRVVHVSYEDLVLNHEQTARHIICDVMKLPWEETVLKSHEFVRAVHTNHLPHFRRPVSDDSIGCWKAYHSYLLPLVKRYLSPHLNRLGYDNLTLPRHLNWRFDQNFDYKEVMKTPLQKHSHSKGRDKKDPIVNLISTKNSQQLASTAPVKGSSPLADRDERRDKKIVDLHPDIPRQQSSIAPLGQSSKEQPLIERAELLGSASQAHITPCFAESAEKYGVAEEGGGGGGVVAEEISLELFLSGVVASLQFVLDMFMFDGLFYSTDVCHRYASEKSITECFMRECREQLLGDENPLPPLHDGGECGATGGGERDRDACVSSVLCNIIARYRCSQGLFISRKPLEGRELIRCQLRSRLQRLILSNV